MQFPSASLLRWFPGILVSLLILLAPPSSLAAETEEDPGYFDFSTEQIEQLVAPIALYPDALLAQILMASTYPLEIIQAARWVEQNADIKGDDLEEAMEGQSWDHSIRSLAAFPQVLEMMSDELAWTQDLGDAFLGQQEEVFDAIQHLRALANEAGNLDDMENQTLEMEEVEIEEVELDEADAVVAETVSQLQTVYVVQPANPQVIFVPVYNPTVVFVPWPHPAFVPLFWRPPGFVVRRMFWFGTGVVVGRALWGGVHWGRRSVNINITRYNQFNRTSITSNRWRHNPSHRGAVPYRGRRTAERYGRTRDSDAIRSREQFRGRAETARRDLPGVERPALGDRQRPAAGERQRPAASQRPARRDAAAPRPSRPAANQRPSNRQSTQMPQRRSAAGGVGNSRQARQSSNRGRSSRGSTPQRQRSGGRRS
jgi:hypothetical protein